MERFVRQRTPLRAGHGGPNSKPIATFDGTDDELATTLALASLISLSAYSLVCVLRLNSQPDVGSDNADATAYDNDGVIGDAAYGGWWTTLRRTGNRVQSGHAGASSIEGVGTNASLSTWYRLRVEYDGTSLTHKLGSNSIATDAVTQTIAAASSASTLIKIGTNYSSSDFAALSLAELFVCNRQLTAPERVSIDSYIDGKFSTGPTTNA